MVVRPPLELMDSTSKKSQKAKQNPRRGGAKSQKKRASQRSSRRRRTARALSTENLKIQREELWDVISVGTGDNTYRLNFDTLTGPPWFKKFSELYEMYQLHHVRIRLISSSATTNSGNWVGGYNTNLSEASATRTAQQIAAQFGARSRNIWQNGTVVIPAGALKGFSTNTPLRSDSNGWLFNLEIATTGVASACAIQVRVEYSVTFRNPQL